MQRRDLGALLTPGTGLVVCRMVGANRPSRRRRRVNLAKSFIREPKFEFVLDELHRLASTAFPVDVCSARLSAGCVGDCSRKRTRFRIRLSRELDVEMAIEVLLHEWAHALAWDYSTDKLGLNRRIPHVEYARLTHGPAWGVAYSRVYAAFAADILPGMD